MPTIELSKAVLLSLQNGLRSEGIEPSDVPTHEQYTEQTGHVEGYEHKYGYDLALQRILNACPICADEDCERGVAYVGATPIHADQHPENKAAKARQRRNETRW